MKLNWALVRKERLELSRLAALEPKSSASTNSATFAPYIFPALAAIITSTRPFYFDHSAPAQLALQHQWKNWRQLAEWHALCHQFQLFGAKVSCQALPDLAAQRHGGGGRVDADQTHAAQDEGQHRGMQLDAARIAEAGDHAVLLHGARQPRQRLAAHRIQRAHPLRLFQRTGAHHQLLARQDFRRTQRL